MEEEWNRNEQYALGGSSVHPGHCKYEGSQQVEARVYSLVTVEVAVGMHCPVLAESQHSNRADTQSSLEEGCQKGLEIGKSFSSRNSKICLG